LVAGLPVSEMWADCHHPERLEEVARVISRNTGRESTTDVLGRLTAMTLAFSVTSSPSGQHGTIRSRTIWRMPMSPPSLVLSKVTAEALDGLYHHRLLSTPQARTMLLPS
jgi:hypothetical protein